MNQSKSGLFLMELIIAIAFFAVAAGVCVQLFAGAHALRERSFNLQMAVAGAQSAAETFKATGGGAGVTGYDERWARVDADRARYVITVQTDERLVPSAATITVTDTARGVELYSLTVRRYNGGRAYALQP